MAAALQYLAPVRSAFESRPFQIFLIGAAVLGFVWYLGRKGGIAKATESITDLPNSGNGIPIGFKPEPYAQELYNVMDGLFTLSTTKEKAFLKVLQLPTDDMIIAVNNAFNRLYLSKNKGTLVQWLDDEFNHDLFSGTKKRLTDRLRALGAK